MKRNSSIPFITVARRTAAMRVPRKRIAALVAFILRAEKAKAGEVEIAVVGDGDMKTLNWKYHHVRGTTDVLSFNLANPGESICAQIIICADEAVRQSKRRGHSPQHELLLYVTHGLLHVLGYEDTTASAAREMIKRQDELLAAFVRG